MSAPALALSGWAATALAIAVARLVLSGRMEAVARACHELRGPLTAARLGLELSTRDGQLSAARLAAIDLELARAALALEDLTRRRGPHCDLRRVDAVDLEQLLAASVEAWRPAAAARGVSIGLGWTGGAAHVWGDRLRLAQATGNLIANAIEHGGGVIEVQGWLDQPRGVARLEVVDEGPGLPAPVLELTRRAKAGRGDRGRGLAIASAIARDHGGRISAAPAERGARLVLELPAAASQQLRGPASG